MNENVTVDDIEPEHCADQSVNRPTKRDVCISYCTLYAHVLKEFLSKKRLVVKPSGTWKSDKIRISTSTGLGGDATITSPGPHDDTRNREQGATLLPNKGGGMGRG